MSFSDKTAFRGSCRDLSRKQFLQRLMVLHLEQLQPAPVQQQLQPAPVLQQLMPASVLQQLMPASMAQQPLPASMAQQPLPAPMTQQLLPAPELEQLKSVPLLEQLKPGLSLAGAACKKKKQHQISWSVLTRNLSVRIYRPRILENKPKTLVFND